MHEKIKVNQCTHRDFRTRYVEDLFAVRYSMSVRGSNSEALCFHPKSKLRVFGTCLFLSFEDFEDAIVFPARHCFGLGTVSISLERPGLERVVHITFGAVPVSRWRRGRWWEGFCFSRGPRRRMPCVVPFGLHGLSGPHFPRASRKTADRRSQCGTPSPAVKSAACPVRCARRPNTGVEDPMADDAARPIATRATLLRGSPKGARVLLTGPSNFI